MDTLERKIIEDCKKNKYEAFTNLYKRYQNYIYTICYRYTGSKEEALDIVQEVFTRIYKSIEGFDLKRPLLPWIRKISVNACISHNKTQNQHISLETEIDEDENTLIDIIPSKDNVEKSVIEEDTGQIIKKYIGRLPDNLKMAITLRHFENLSYDEISEAMGIPVGTVKTYIHRARTQLKDMLNKIGFWEN